MIRFLKDFVSVARNMISTDNPREAIDLPAGPHLPAVVSLIQELPMVGHMPEAGHSTLANGLSPSTDSSTTEDLPPVPPIEPHQRAAARLRERHPENVFRKSNQRPLFLPACQGRMGKTRC